MSLTKGSGPFGEHAAGEFDFDPQAPEHVLYVERTPRRMRVFLHGYAVADSDDVRLLHPPGRTPSIAGLIAFDWDSFSVFEEDQEVFVPPATPTRASTSCAAPGTFV